MDANEAMLFPQALYALKNLLILGALFKPLRECKKEKSKKSGNFAALFVLPGYWMPGIDGIPAKPFWRSSSVGI